MDRRGFLRGALAVGAVGLGSAFWRTAFASSHVVPGDSPYGPLGLEIPAHGVRLPADFEIREVARAANRVPGAAYVWHRFPDGGAVFGAPDGGWVYACNSEVDFGLGGAGAVRFDASGAIVDAYPILVGTTRNCAGGPTPWGTWLSCEETMRGRVWECDPLGLSPPLVRDGLGWFSHEAAAVDPVTGYVYLTEDENTGLFYRFRPSDPQTLPVLDDGVLEAAEWSTGNGTVSWHRVPFPNPLPFLHGETRRQLVPTTAFNRGEGAWFDAAARTVYFVTTGDGRIWAHDVAANTLEILYWGSVAAGNRLNGPDNITVHPSGALFVCEDGGDMELHVIANGVIAPVMQLTGEQHIGSELTGVAFDATGTRMYVNSQRGYGAGVTYEITGPFGEGLS